MAKSESVFYRYLRDQFKSLSLIRIENSALQGTPDLLIQNKEGTFFTVELKVIKSNRKPKFSPHQIETHHLPTLLCNISFRRREEKTCSLFDCEWRIC